MTWFLKLVFSLVGKVGLSGLLKSIGGLGLSLAFPGWGALVSMALAAGQSALAFFWDQAKQTLADCIKNPRVFIVIGIAVAVGNWHGWGNGVAQGEGDLKTYKQEAEVYQKQADDTAKAATAAKDAAKKAEAAKIASEKAKAVSDAKAKKAVDELAATKAKVAADAKAVADKAAANAKRRRKKVTPSSSSTDDAWSFLGAMFRT